MLYRQSFFYDVNLGADLLRWAMLGFLSFLLFVPVAIGQGEPKAVLVDSFGGSLGFEEVLAAADVFGTIITSNPGKTGVLYAFAPENEEARAERTINFIYRALLGRWGLNVKFSAYLVRSEKALNFSFYAVPQDADAPITGGKMMAEIPFAISERFFFGVDSGDPCANNISIGFVSVLRSNPNYVGQIVVVNTPSRRQNETAARWFKYFEDEHSLERKSLRVFFKKDDSPDLPFGEYVEFWFKPIKK